MSLMRDNMPSSYGRLRDEANHFFEAQLERMGLSEAQIKKQKISALEDSLIRIDDALRNPESFGVMRVSVNAGSAVLLQSNIETHLEIGIVPILLERKKLVVERLRHERSDRPIHTLAEMIDSIRDSGLREKLRTELDATKQMGPAGKSHKTVQSGSAFIAMAMDPNDRTLEDVLDAIKEASKKCGVMAERIDEAISNEPITRRMLEAIEAAGFVVVDVTHGRPNVFYEAGYAQGLGKTPIFIARGGTDIPFDVRDYPVILYPNMRELKVALGERLSSVREGRVLPARNKGRSTV